MTTAVICLGNELVGDDGLGIRVGRVLQRLELPKSVEVLIRPNLGLELIELLGEYDDIILVDAMTSGRSPGTCVHLDPQDAANMAACPSCSHSLGIPEILQLVARMYPDRAETAIRIIGVEAASIDQFEIGLSPPVRAAMPQAVEKVLEVLSLDDETRKKARQEAVRESNNEISLTDIVSS